MDPVLSPPDRDNLKRRAARRRLWQRAADRAGMIWSIVRNGGLVVLMVGLIVMIIREMFNGPVEIATIEVPKDLVDRGYTAQALAHQLVGAIQAIHAQAGTTMKPATIGPTGEHPDITLPGTSLSVTSVAHYLRTFFGFPITSVNGEVIERGSLMRLRLRITGDKQIFVSDWVTVENVDDVINPAAEGIMKETEPFILASYYYGLNRKDEAMSLARRIIDAPSAGSEQVVRAHNLIGLTLSNEHDLDSAIAEYRHALELDPKVAYVHNNLGLALAGKGQLDEAIAEYRRALDLDPKYAYAHGNLGEALRENGELDKAIAENRHALELDPKAAFVHNNLGLALQDNGRLDEAIAEYRRALELDPKAAYMHNNLGLALAGKGQLDAAIAEYHRALELDPKYAYAHGNLGNALRDKGQLDKAIAEYRRTLNLDPKNETAQRGLAQALKSKGQPD